MANGYSINNRKIQEEHNWKYITFAILVALLIEKTKPKYKVIIDIEYFGHESLIAIYIRKTLEILKVKNIPPLRFQCVGKSSPAHKLAYHVALNMKKADIIISSEKVRNLIEEIWKQKK